MCVCWSVKVTRAFWRLFSGKTTPTPKAINKGGYRLGIGKKKEESSCSLWPCVRKTPSRTVLCEGPDEGPEGNRQKSPNCSFIVSLVVGVSSVAPQHKGGAFTRLDPSHPWEPLSSSPFGWGRLGCG